MKNCEYYFEGSKADKKNVCDVTITFDSGDYVTFRSNTYIGSAVSRKQFLVDAKGNCREISTSRVNGTKPPYVIKAHIS